MGKRGLNSRAQLTLFVIFGVIVVGAIIFLFGFYKPELNPFRQTVLSPNEAVSTCIEDALKVSEKEFFDSESLLLDTSLMYHHNQKKMPFLCYSTEFYFPCVPQHPLLIESVRTNMENKVSRELSRCVLTLKEDYEKRGYLFQYSDFNFSLVFNDLDIFYKAGLNIVISKGDESILVSTREGRFSSFLPKLLRTAETIVNFEAVLCEFDPLSWQAMDRSLTITRFRAGDQTKVYTLRGKDSDDEIKFAIRTCVMPAGI